MSLFVNVCSKLDPNAANIYNKIGINDLKTSVQTLAEQVCNQLHLSRDQFDLMCYGRILVSDKSLDFYKIKNGTIVWIIHKTYLINGEEEPSEPKPVVKSRASQSEIQNMVIALKTALMNSNFRQMLDKLNDNEFRENLMAVTPGLREDTTALAILQDPELLSTLSEPTHIHKVLEKHPSLLEAATFLAATFHEETIANESGPSSGLLSRSTSGLDYSLDAMSSDEEMDSSEDPSDPATARRIAEMMGNAYRQRNRNTSSSTLNGSEIITHDMLRQALQQTESSSSSSTPTTPTISQPSPAPGPSGPSASTRVRQWSAQLQLLRDLGVNDPIIALQALEATDGDVQAAINIIFSDN